MRAAGGLKADLGMRPPRHPRSPLPPTWPSPALGLGGGQPQQQSCGTRARTTRLPCALRVHAVDGPGDRGVRFPSGREFGGLRPSAPYTP